VQGRGFGHGVGLCQEGAMEMALRGISHKEILNFYYTEVALIDIASLRFLLR
jgi:stage II sporulation protein D